MARKTDRSATIADAPIDSGPSAAPGRRTLTQRIVRRARAGGDVTADAESALDRAAVSSGAPLRADLRDRFEGALDADLSAVRVHTGAESAQAAGAVGANAYAIGNDIHFGSGQYRPDDPSGVHLIAHEVAHTQQQTAGVPERQNQLEVSQPGDPAEAEADRVADVLVAGESVSVGGGAAPRIARQPGGESTAGKADLVVTSVTAEPGRVAIQRDPLHVKVEVENQGRGPAGRHAVDVLFKTDKGKVTKGHEVDPLHNHWWKSVSGLAPGKKKEVEFNAVTPRRGVTTGVHTIGAGLIGKDMNDADESNNVGWGPDVNIVDFNGKGLPDPALGYTAEAKAEMKQIDGEKLPYAGKDAWKSAEILAKWGQVDNSQATDTDDLRCGPTVALAGFIVDGPGVVYGAMHWLNNKSAETIHDIEAKGTPEQKKRIPELRAAKAELLALFPEFLPEAQAATYGSLSRLAHLMKILGTTSKDEVATGGDMNNFTALGRATHEMNKMVRSKSELSSLLDILEHNARYSLTVDTDLRPAERRAGLQMSDFNHWIMIAKVGTQGRVVLYDPYPRTGKQYLYLDQDPDAFWAYFINEDHGEKVWRGCWIANKSGDVTPFKIPGLTEGA
jgi:hypothetical protein